MNCCDEYGQCQQGQGCPARTTPVEPEENQPWSWIDDLRFLFFCALVGFVFAFAWAFGSFISTF